MKTISFLCISICSFIACSAESLPQDFASKGSDRQIIEQCLDELAELYENVNNDERFTCQSEEGQAYPSHLRLFRFVSARKPIHFASRYAKKELGDGYDFDQKPASFPELQQISRWPDVKYWTAINHIAPKHYVRGDILELNSGFLQKDSPLVSYTDNPHSFGKIAVYTETGANILWKTPLIGIQCVPQEWVVDPQSLNGFVTGRIMQGTLPEKFNQIMSTINQAGEYTLFTTHGVTYPYPSQDAGCTSAPHDKKQWLKMLLNPCYELLKKR